MPNEYLYLDSDFNPVDESKATLLKIVQDDGTVIFATPAEPSKTNSLVDSLFGWIPKMFQQGGAGSGFEGHRGRPGKRGGSLPRSGGAGGVSVKDAVKEIDKRLEGRVEKGLTEKERGYWESMEPMTQAGVEMSDGSKQFYLFKQEVIDDITIEIPGKFDDSVDFDEDSLVAWEKMTDEDNGVLYGGGDLVEFAKYTYNFEDEESGMSSKITKVSEDYDTIYFSGEILDPDGNKVGAWKQSINGYGEVGHDYLEIDKEFSEWQGRGFGMRFYHHMEESYTEIGVFAIAVNANITVGGYAWAAAGYSWNEREENGRSWTESFVESWMDEGYSLKDLPASIEGYTWQDDNYILQPYEMTTIYSPDGDHFGKNFLLGTDWNGVKILQEGVDEKYDIALEISEKYYSDKGIH